MSNRGKRPPDEGRPGGRPQLGQRRGQPIDSSAWPLEGAFRDWLAYCDRVHRANNLRSLRTVARKMGLTSPTRVSQLLRGLAWPADDDQAKALLHALGA